jgi:sugar lactone lactonase YvrE
VKARGSWVALLVGGAALFAAPPAGAVPDCPSKPVVRVLETNQGKLESILGDARGRLYYTDTTNNRLLRLDGPGQPPKVIATDMNRSGQMDWEPGGTMVIGFSGGSLSGVPGNGMAGLFRVNPETGAKKIIASGFDQANGVIRGPDGFFYASNDIGGGITRIAPDGTVQKGWANVPSPNGLVIDSHKRYLFTPETFQPAQISRVDLAHPDQVTTYYAAGPQDIAAGLDDLARDAVDRLFVAANGGGEVWRVDTDGQACALVRGLVTPSASAFGGGGAFPRRNLYVVTFTGQLLELVDVTDRPPAPAAGSPGPVAPAPSPPGQAPSPGSVGVAPKPRLGLSVRPRQVRAGRRARLRFVVTVGGQPVSGVSIRVGQRTVVTGARGRVSLAYRFRRPGAAHVRAVRVGYRLIDTTIRVLPSRRSARHPAERG